MATATVVPSFATTGSGGAVNGTAGTVTVPGVNLGETNTGFYSPATHQVAVTTNGTQAALWDASQNETVPAAATKTWLGSTKESAPADGQLKISKNDGTAATLSTGIVLGAGASLVYDNAVGLRAMNAAQGANLGFAGTAFVATNSNALYGTSGTVAGINVISGTAMDFRTNNQIYQAVDTNQNISYNGTGGSTGTNKASTLNLKSVSANTTLGTGGTTTTIVQIPAGSIVMAVTARVTTLITAALSTSWALAAGTVTYATGKAFALGTTVTSADYQATFVGPTFYAAATNLVVTLNSDAATAGAVRCVVFYFDTTAPTS